MTSIQFITFSCTEPERLADFFEAVFQQAFGYPDDYRAWAVTI